MTCPLTVLGDVTQKQAPASSIHGPGTRSGELLTPNWDADSFLGLHVSLNSTAGQLDSLAANHKLYPIFYYFYSPHTEQASTMNIAVFDEMLTHLAFGVLDQTCSTAIAVGKARSSLEGYLTTPDNRFEICA